MDSEQWFTINCTLDTILICHSMGNSIEEYRTKMKRIEPTIINNPFPSDFMAKFIDEFERVMKAREVMTREQCADFLGLSTTSVDRLTNVVRFHFIPSVDYLVDCT
jgi:hypothetical protein